MKPIKRPREGLSGGEASQAKTFRLRDEDARRLAALKGLWGCSEAAVIRRLLIEAARREQLAQALPPGEPSAPALTPEDRTTPEKLEQAPTISDRPIWEELVEIASLASEEDPTPLPTDLAEQHDHYIYGTPKR
jgi:hypothetical protein